MISVCFQEHRLSLPPRNRQHIQQWSQHPNQHHIGQSMSIISLLVSMDTLLIYYEIGMERQKNVKRNVLNSVRTVSDLFVSIMVQQILWENVISDQQH